MEQVYVDKLAKSNNGVSVYQIVKTRLIEP